MKTTFDYGREAELCLEAAEKATSPESRKFLMAMARVWSNLAGHGDDAGAQGRNGAPTGGDEHAWEAGTRPQRGDEGRLIT